MFSLCCLVQYNEFLQKHEVLLALREKKNDLKVGSPSVVYSNISPADGQYRLICTRLVEFRFNGDLVYLKGFWLTDDRKYRQRRTMYVLVKILAFFGQQNVANIHDQFLLNFWVVQAIFCLC